MTGEEKRYLDNLKQVLERAKNYGALDAIEKLEKENAELEKICDFNCPVHKLATHNTCLFCSAVRNSPHRNLKNVTDEELQKIIKDAEAEMEM